MRNEPLRTSKFAGSRAQLSVRAETSRKRHAQFVAGEQSLLDRHERELRVLRVVTEIARLDAERCSLGDRSVFSVADQQALAEPQHVLHKPDGGKLHFRDYTDAEIDRLEDFARRLKAFVCDLNEIKKLQGEIGGDARGRRKNRDSDAIESGAADFCDDQFDRNALEIVADAESPGSETQSSLGASPNLDASTVQTALFSDSESPSTATEKAVPRSKELVPEETQSVIPSAPVSDPAQIATTGSDPFFDLKGVETTDDEEIEVYIDEDWPTSLARREADEAERKRIAGPRFTSNLCNQGGDFFEPFVDWPLLVERHGSILGYSPEQGRMRGDFYQWDKPVSDKALRKWRAKLPWIWPWRDQFRLQSIREMEGWKLALVNIVSTTERRLCRIGSVRQGYGKQACIETQPILSTGKGIYELFAAENIEKPKRMLVTLPVDAYSQALWVGLKFVARRAAFAGRRAKFVDIDQGIYGPSSRFFELAQVDAAVVGFGDVLEGDHVFCPVPRDDEAAVFKRSLTKLATCVCHEPRDVPSSGETYELSIPDHMKLIGAFHCDFLNRTLVPGVDPKELDTPENIDDWPNI